MAVIDSSVLIHLVRIGKILILKKYFKKIKITEEVYNELKAGNLGLSEFERACNDWIEICKPKKTAEIDEISRLELIEKADASIIVLAKEKKEVLVSNDYTLIMVARAKGITCWWLTTFLLRCLENRLLTKKEAKQILFDLIKTGMRLDNAVFTSILEEIEKY